MVILHGWGGRILAVKRPFCGALSAPARLHLTPTRTPAWPSCSARTAAESCSSSSSSTTAVPRALHFQPASAQRGAFRCAAQPRGTSNERKSRQGLTARGGVSSGSSGGNGGDEEDQGYGLLKWSNYRDAQGWDTPWGWPTIILGMVTWAVSFVLVGVLTIPFAIGVLGIHPVDHFTALESSELALANQVVATLVGLAIVWTIGKRGGEDTPPDYLTLTLEKPFAKPNGWAVWALAGLAIAPVAIVGTSLLVSLLPEAGGRGTVDGVASMIATQVDPSVFTNLLLVTGVLAPVLEETVFRGFLLTSLTRYTSVPVAVTLSSVAFAACHLSVRDFPQLFALGMVMGFVYARSRNLMSNIVIHGAWNSGVLTLLFALVQSGTSMEEILGR